MPTTIERVYPDGQSEILEQVFPAEVALIAQGWEASGVEQFFVVACDKHDVGADIYFCALPDDVTDVSEIRSCAAVCTAENHIGQIHDGQEVAITKTGKTSTAAAQILIKHAITMSSG